MKGGVFRMGVRSGSGGVSSGVQSVERALDVFEFLGRSEGEVGVSEIGAATGLSVGTAHRLLGTLVSRGYAHHNGSTRKYGLGLKSLAVAAAARERVGPLALPFLEELMEACQETANLAILEGKSVMYIEQVVPPARTLRISMEPGVRVPLHSTGTGKILLAYQPPRLLDFFIGEGGLPRQTVSTITDPGQLRSELTQTRRRGFAVDFEEQEEGVRCVAAPVFGPDGEIFAAMSVSGPMTRLGNDRVETLAPDLRRIADNLSDALDSL